MLVSFPLQGYALFSILFSSLHILISYWFVFAFLRDLKKNYSSECLPGVSIYLVRASIFFMVLSSLGPLSLGAISARFGHGSDMYYNAIYFFLHFQYNGWFTMAILGILFRILEKNKIIYPLKAAVLTSRLFVYAVVPAYLLSVLWTHPPLWVNAIAAFAALAQLIAAIVILILLKKVKNKIFSLFKGTTKLLLAVSFLSFLLKILLQLISSLPYFSILMYEIKDFIIAYLHLSLLGFVSTFILSAFIFVKILRPTRAGTVFFSADS